MMKYCSEGKVEINVMDTGFINDKKCLIKFSFATTRNPEINELPILEMLESLKSGEGQKFTEEQIIQKYVKCFDFINQFGIGMLIFPKILERLEGTYTYVIQNQSENMQLEENKEEGLEQDKAP
mmetsp:Transcript_39560/g.38069  ORF Transcript_39560/g.38069 Transcript_39560/m.38069 type:complete len:124 (+) Transcript_39560:1656-2027(+)